MKRIKILIVIPLFFGSILIANFLRNSQSFSEQMNEKKDESIVKENNTNMEKELEQIMGKWKFTKRIAYPRAYSEEGQKDSDKIYLGREIEIKGDFFSGKTFVINNPYYNFIRIQEPYEYFYGNGYNRDKNLNEYIKSKEYLILELLSDNSNLENKDMITEYSYDHFDAAVYDSHDILSLFIIDSETMIFCESGCYELKKCGDVSNSNTNG